MCLETQDLVQKETNGLGKYVRAKMFSTACRQGMLRFCNNLGFSEDTIPIASLNSVKRSRRLANVIMEKVLLN